MITTTAARKAGKLPGGYTKLAEVAYQVRFQVWVTVARFHTVTQGQNDVFFIHNDETGTLTEISLNEYAHHIRSSVPTLNS